MTNPETNETNSVTIIAPPTAPDWSNNPMLRQLSDVFQNIGNQVSESFTLRARVAKLEADVDYFKETIQTLMSENATLKASVRESNESALSAINERDQLRATLDHTKQSLAETQAELCQVLDERNHLQAEFGRVNDDHVLAKMEAEDWKAKHEEVSAGHETTRLTLETDRKHWFEQEEKLQTFIRALTAERNLFRDKFDRSKSHAAQIMAMDQAKPVVEQPDYH